MCYQFWLSILIVLHKNNKNGYIAKIIYDNCNQLSYKMVEFGNYKNLHKKNTK